MLHLFGVRSINLLQLSHVRLPISGTVTRKGLTTPLTCRVASICSLYEGTIYIVLFGSSLNSYMRDLITL